MKRFLALLTAIFMIASLAGCTNGENGGIIDNVSEGDTNTVGEKYTLRLGVFQTHNASEGKALFSSTYTAVICDEKGTIVDCIFDATEDTVSFDGGIISSDGAYLSKRQQGDDYGMKDASPIGREWYSQADHFAQLISGLTLSDAANLSGDTADLTSGCTIDITGFKGALEKAMKNDSHTAEFYSEAIPRASLSVLSRGDGSKDATEETDGISAMTSTYGAVATDGDLLLSALLEETETKVYFDNSGLVITIDGGLGKREEGDSYGMKASSAIGLEWYQQAESFEKYVAGMKKQSVSDIKTEDMRPADPDLLSGCTIKINDFISVLTSAMK